MKSVKRVFGASIAAIGLSVAVVLASGHGGLQRLTAHASSMLAGSGKDASGNARQPASRLAVQRQPVLDDGQETVGIPWVGEPGIEETVSDIMMREQALAPVRDSRVKEPRPELHQNRKGLPQNPLSPSVSHWPERAGEELTADRSAETPKLPQTTGVSFVGATLAETSSLPPDSMGDIGPTQFLVGVNGRIKVFDRQGNLGPLNTDIDVFFDSVRGGISTSDPRVRYDRLSGRWFVTIITTNTPNKILLAVSDSSTITGASSFTFFSFQHDLVGTTPNSDTNRFADYDTLGVDANALYVGVNIFNGTSFVSTTGFVVRKSSVLSGGPIVVTAFRQLGTPTTVAGPYTPQGVDNDDPSATEGYFAGVDTLSFGLLQLRRISDPGGTPSISANIPLTVPSTQFPIGTPVLGSTKPLDGSDDRLLVARIHLDKIANQMSLWTTHNIQVDAAGTASDSGGRNAMRWYQITNLTSTPTLIQSGTLFDSAASNPANYWMGSLAMSGQGHMALSSSVAGAAQHAEIAAAGRLSSDTAGVTQSPTVVQTSAFTYNVQPNRTAQRWGDYSIVSVDPNDDMTFWTVQEYCDANNSYAVQVIQLKAPLPATPSSSLPSSLATGVSSANIIVTGTSSNGSGFFDPGTGFANRISVAITNGVTVNSVSFTDPTHVTINVSTVGATAGAAVITVTNPDGQSAASAAGILTITGGTVVFEADVSPRPAGDGSVTIADWVQVGRFAAGLDTVTAGAEFQKADCAPRASLGDGTVSIADWIQAGRYAAGLDPATAIGGPATQPTSTARTTLSSSSTGQRKLKIVANKFRRGQIAEVKIKFKSLGNENALGFTLFFDPSVASFSDVVAVNAAAGATLQVNASDAASGRVGIAIAQSAGSSFPAGNYNIVKVRLLVLPASKTSSTFLQFGDGPIVREVADVNATIVPIVYVGLSVPVRGGSTAARESRSAAGSSARTKAIQNRRRE